MDFEKVVARRRSVRKYRPDPVPEALLEECLRLAARCPSAGAVRGWEATPTALPLTKYDAPLAVVVSALPERYARRYGSRGRDLYAVQDATIFAAYLQLAAVSLGLSSVWVGAFREESVRRALGLPGDRRPVAIILLGYAA